MAPISASAWTRIVAQAERRSVGQGVVADPVPLGPGALRRAPRERVPQPLADDEEGRTPGSARMSSTASVGPGQGPLSKVSVSRVMLKRSSN